MRTVDLFLVTMGITLITLILGFTLYNDQINKPTCNYDSDVLLNKARFEFYMSTPEGQSDFNNYYKYPFDERVKLTNDMYFTSTYARCK